MMLVHANVSTVTHPGTDQNNRTETIGVGLSQTPELFAYVENDLNYNYKYIYIKTTKDFFDSQATEAFNVQLCLSPLNESDPPRVSTRYQNLQ